MAFYTYNALGQRISEQYDCNDSGGTGVTDGVADAYDPVFFIANDRMGRRVATFRNTDTYPKETFIYHADGAYGPNFAGGVALRDRDSQLTDPTKWATTSAASTRTERYFYCADAKGSVMALMTGGGALGEQYRYSPTGVAYGIPLGDMDADGEVISYQITDVDNVIVSNATYQVRKDVNLDGVVDGADKTIVVARHQDMTGRGRLSAARVFSRGAWRRSSVEPWGLAKAVFGNVFHDACLAVRITTQSGVSSSVVYGHAFELPNPSSEGADDTPPSITMLAVPGCPLKEPVDWNYATIFNPVVGDGWCSEGQSSAHCDLICYRSYGTGTSMGQQCCYLPGGTLMTTPPCAGTVDLSGPAIGDNPDGTCDDGGWWPQKDQGWWPHMWADGMPWKVNKPLYQQWQQCLRDNGIPSGTPGPDVTEEDIRRAVEKCRHIWPQYD